MNAYHASATRGVICNQQINLFFSKLKSGDCGLILYYENEDGSCQPMGLFVGELLDDKTFGKPIYQAIILNQAFTDIEFDYPHQVRNIRLFQADDIT